MRHIFAAIITIVVIGLFICWIWAMKNYDVIAIISLVVFGLAFIVMVYYIIYSSLR